MTDIDRMLAEDGARWRAAQPTPSEPDPAVLAGPRRPRWQPLAAAAAVAALAAGAVSVASRHESADPAPSPAARSSDPTVRDGDRVTGDGAVSAVDGRPVRLCADGHTTRNDAYYPPSKAHPKGLAVTGDAVYCQNGLTLIGLDLDRIANRRTARGGVVGYIGLTGVYRHGTITVTEQRAPSRSSSNPPAEPLAPACRPPAGGWSSQGTPSDADIARVKAYVEAHPTEFSAFWVGSPTAPTWRPQVLTVTTPRALDAATRAIRTIYRGPLCVAPAGRTLASVTALRDRLGRMIYSADAARYGLTGFLTDAHDSRGEPYLQLGVQVWTPVVDELRQSLRTDAVSFEPALRKVP